jgi:GntR family transcriptional repressor for pyruvate dehydrogenase complex
MDDDSSLPPAPVGADVLRTLTTLAPIARQSVVDAVADRIRSEIVAGRLRPGSRLPSERELSLALGVNRLTLRASLARLEALGLLVTRHGAGTVVASWRERAGLEMLGTLLRGRRLGDRSWHDLVRSALEIRRIIAGEAVALAAERHTPEDLDAIASCGQEMGEHMDDPVAFARADLAFMRAVCRAAHNVAFELFLNTFARWPDDHPELVGLLYDDRIATAAMVPAVVDLVRTRDGEAARVLVRAALEAADGAWSARHPPPGPSTGLEGPEGSKRAVARSKAGSGSKKGEGAREGSGSSGS